MGRKWYKVYLANNDVRLMSRGWGERWRSNDKCIRFRDDNGHEVTFPAAAHWVLFWEHIAEDEVSLVRTELTVMREERLKREREEG